MSSSATINVRLDPRLKETGDAVLEHYGMSTSKLIRLLWQEMADTRQLPACVQKSLDAEKDREKRVRLKKLDHLCGLAKPKGKIQSTDELLDSVYDDMLRAYLELS